MGVLSGAMWSASIIGIVIFSRNSDSDQLERFQLKRVHWNRSISLFSHYPTQNCFALLLEMH
ncbi:hypothetical protein BLA27_01470 [Brucella cytisi]|uniref:Uncharacterized protein n=1 Tax=Brucella cytisi TaxID=407152 RepID=A0A1J6I4F5_9HYPH|nr:hypothetical protein BLA27_01470 [Brucella cytisi]